MHRYLLRLSSFGLLATASGCGEPALNLAIQASDMQQAQKLIESGTDVNAAGKGWRTPLHVAIERGDKDTYKLLLEKGANPNRCDGNGSSILHLGAQLADLYWLKLALQHGGNPDQPNTGNRFFPNSTPIFYACSKENTPAVLELIAAKADVNHVAKKGDRPLDRAMGSQMYVAALALVEAGAIPNLGDKAGVTFARSYFTDAFEKLAASKHQEYPAYLALKELLIKKGYL